MQEGNSVEPVGWTEIRKINNIQKDLKTIIFKITSALPVISQRENLTEIPVLQNFSDGI